MHPLLATWTTEMLADGTLQEQSHNVTCRSPATLFGQSGEGRTRSCPGVTVGFIGGGPLRLLEQTAAGMPYRWKYVGPLHHCLPSASRFTARSAAELGSP